MEDLPLLPTTDAFIDKVTATIITDDLNHIPDDVKTMFHALGIDLDEVFKQVSVIDIINGSFNDSEVSKYASMIGLDEQVNSARDKIRSVIEAINKVIIEG